MPAIDRYDLAVIGSGFGGSIMAMILRRLGYHVILLERGSHPRFVIGESSTPFSNLLLEALAQEYNLPFLRELSEWGKWQKSHPGISCGLKRGFTFYHHKQGEPLDFADRQSQLLVAASPNDAVADTHWYRPEFDRFLVEKVVELGVIYRDHAQIEICEQGTDWKLRVTTPSESRRIEAGFVIDATGPGGVLPNHLQIAREPFGTLPPTGSVYAHFVKVDRLQASDAGDRPYPPDDAAVHHIFDGGWIWVLRFNNGITSAGAAFRRDRFPPEVPPAVIWEELLESYPTIQQQFASAIPVTPFHSIPQLSFRHARAAEGNWALLPSCTGFVDPLLSTGFALNLLGIRRLGAVFQQPFPSRLKLLTEYERKTLRELDVAADLVSALYGKLNSFQEFAALSLLYFVAMSFSETAWRLHKPSLADGFLLNNDPTFSAIRERFCQAARQAKPIDIREVAKALEPWDIAGLTDIDRSPWYPVCMDDLVRNRTKLGASEEEIRQLLRSLGL